MADKDAVVKAVVTVATGIAVGVAATGVGKIVEKVTPPPKEPTIMERIER